MAEIPKKKRRYIRGHYETQSPAELSKSTGIDEEEIRRFLKKELNVDLSEIEKQDLEAGFPLPVVKFAEKYEWFIAGGMAAIYVIYFFTLCFLKYRAYTYGDFDLPIFDQGVWSTATFNGFFKCSIRFGYVFTDHLSFILIGAVPLYWIFGWLMPGALILLFLQTAALGGAAIPIYLLARRKIGKVMGLVIVAAYLLYPALGYMNLFEFHPGVLAVFFLAWTFYFLHVRRWMLFIVFMALSLACREDVSVPVFMLGLYALYASWRNKLKLKTWPALKWTIVPCVVGLLYFALAVKVIVPAFNPGGKGAKASPFVNLYAYLTVDHNKHLNPEGKLVQGQKYNLAVMKARKNASTGKIFSKILFSPLECFQHASKRSRKHVGWYTVHLIAPVGGISLLAPQTLVLALPTYFQNVLASKPEPSTIFYQYSANVIPFIFISLIMAMAWLRGFPSIRRQSAVLAVYVLLSAVVSSGFWGKQLNPAQNVYGEEAAIAAAKKGKERLIFYGYKNNLMRDDFCGVKDIMIEKLAKREREKHDGEKKALAVSFDFLHRVPMRRTLHSWHYIKGGRDPITGEAVTTPQVDYALLDFTDDLTFRSFTSPLSAGLQRKYLQDGNWRVLHQLDSILLLERGTGTGNFSSLAAVVNEPRKPRPGQPKLKAVDPRVDPGVHLISSEIIPEKTVVSEGDKRNVLRVICHYAIDDRLYAQRSQVVYMLLAVFEVVGPKGRCYFRGWPIAYTLIAPDEWPRHFGAGGVVKTVRVNYPLLLPPGSPSGKYRVNLSIRQQTLGQAFSKTVLGSVGVK